MNQKLIDKKAVFDLKAAFDAAKASYLKGEIEIAVAHSIADIYRDELRSYINRYSLKLRVPSRAKLMR